MSIGAVGSGTDITSLLRANGLSSTTADYVASEVQDVTQASGPISTQTLDQESVSAALSARIDADVAAGKLSASDASTIKQTLGLSEDTSSGESSTATTAAASTEASASSASSAASGAGGAGGGGGGSDDSSDKTEVSRTETIANGVKTTVIVYDDGSSETQVAYTAAPDTSQSAAVASAYGQEDADSYLASIAHGTFLDTQA